MKIGDKIYIRNIREDSVVSGFNESVQIIRDFLENGTVYIKNSSYGFFENEFELIPEELQDADIQTIKLYFAL